VHVEFLVIGSGPAGQTAAIAASKLGKQVVLIEQDEVIGGASLNYGTIPSKSLREAIVDLTRFDEQSFYGVGRRDVSINDLNFRLHRILDEERASLARRFKKNKIKVIHGAAHFLSSHKIQADDQIFECDTIVIASGSKPRNPMGIPFDDEVILDSTRLLSIGSLPRSMLVLGAGIVGTEYASFFAALGIETTIIDKKSHLLPLLDCEVGIHLQTALTEIGLRFLGSKIPKEIKRVDDRAQVSFQDGTTLEADKLLYALGRTANLGDLDLEKAYLHSKKGFIPVNEHFQTSQPHIYAVGDVIGAPALSATSFEQGRLAARHACGIPSTDLPKSHPLGIYTIPEISSIGSTEETLEGQGRSYEVGRAYYYEIARGHITGSDIGMFKILFDPETLELLGVHIIGRSATELIHIGQMAMNLGAPLDFFINQVFNYPTFAEGYRIAALNGMNKIRRLL